jgi:hypothetical protein
MLIAMLLAAQNNQLAGETMIPQYDEVRLEQVRPGAVLT